MAGKYHLVIDGQKRGPFAKEELEGQGLQRDTLVWYRGLPDWVIAGRVPELLDVFAEPPPVPSLAPLPDNLTIPDRLSPPSPPSEHVKDPAVSIPPSAAPPPAYAADGDSLLSIASPFSPWRIPYDAVGMRRLYLGAMATYVPGLVLLLGFGVTIAWLGIHGIEIHTPRFDPRQHTIVFDFDPGAQTLQTMTAIAAVGMGLLGVIGLGIGAACYFVLLYRAWRIVFDGRSGPSPARAIGFLFIPFFNVYWVYVALWGLACRLNRLARRHELDVPTASQPLGLAMSVYTCLMYLPFPFAGLVPLTLNLILWPLFMRSVYRTTAALCEDANRERIAQGALSPSLVHPDLSRPVSAHILSIAAMVLALIGTPLFALGFGFNLDAQRHFHRDLAHSAALREGIEHLRPLNPPDRNRLHDFENHLRNREGMLMRWREHLIISGAVLGGGVLVLTIVLVLAHVARLCARASEEAPPAPSAWPAPHGAGF
jgi:hypothetical protein